MRGTTLALLAEIRADPSLQPLAPAAEKGIAFLEAEAWFEALRATHRQLRVNPDDPSALLNEGIILVRLGACSNAIPPLTRVLALTNSPVALLNRANAYLGVSNLAAAQTDYLKLRQAWPKDCRVYFGLGEIAYRRKDTNAAIGYYRDYLANAAAGTEGAKFVADRLKALRQDSP
jgi:Flp pilus assembly protein TadD